MMLQSGSGRCYKPTYAVGLALVLFLPATAFGACQDVRNQIAQKIEANGVPPFGYSLEVMPTADADQAEGQIVGHCENNRYQIVYQRQYQASSAETMENTSSDEEAEDVSIGNEQSSADIPPEATDARSGSNMGVSDNGRVKTSDMPEGSSSTGTP